VALVRRGFRVGREDRVFAACCTGSAAFSAWFIGRAEFRLADKPAWALFDDAMISMRYARNFARGDGLVWNAGGPRVEGFTNPLWTMWMALLHKLVPLGTFKESVLVMLSSAVLLLAILWITRQLARELLPDQPALADVATVLVATFYPLLYWSLSGMEVGLLTALIGLVVLYGVRFAQRDGDWTRRDDIRWALASVGAIATRLDAAVAVGVVVLFCAWSARGDRSRRIATLLRLGAAPATGLALMTAARLAYYGDWLPNTYYLKATGTSLGLRLGTGARHLVLVVAAQLAVMGLAALAGLLLDRDSRPRAAWLLAGVGAAQALYSVSVGGDAWEWMLIANRYLTVTTIPMVVLAARGIGALAADPHRRLATFCLTVAALVVAVRFLAPGPDGLEDLAVGILHLEVHDKSAAYLAIAAAVGLIGLGALRAKAPSLRPRTALVVLTVVVVVLTNLRGFDSWRQQPGLEMHEELAREGWALRAAADTDTVVAVWLAGSDPYYSDLPAVDLFGKSDRHIARLHSDRDDWFLPGHSKSDLGWSLETYHPDVVRLPGLNDGFAPILVKHGYEEVAFQLWARPSSLDKVDLDVMRAFLSAEQEREEGGES